ncbi:MAG: SGNH/GDSL hydrolase family protein [Luteimonas sp.]
MRYLALGDSYTIGEGVAADARWPLLLARALQAEDIALDDPRIIATTGWTTDELATAIDAAEPLDEWDLVTLMVGVNNQYRGRDIGNYRDEFNGLLLRAIAFTGGRADRVLVLSIPDWGVTRFGADSGRNPGQIAREVDAFNAVALATCVAHDVAFVDITPLSRQLGAEAAMLADDGLHPSAAMHALFAACALPVARRLLAKA